MSAGLKEKSLGTLILIVILGIIMGSYLSALIGLIPGDNVVKMLFSYNFIDFGFGYPVPFTIDLHALKFQIGIQVKFSLLSIFGIFISLYFFRWYK